MISVFIRRMVLRELRSSSRRIGLYMGSIALGVAALVSINSFRTNLTTALQGQSRVLLGADVELSSRRPFTPQIRAVLDSTARAGTPVSFVTRFASMALAPKNGATRLVEIRAVEGDFPYYGAIETDPAGRWTALQDDRQALADSTVLIQLNVAIGDTLAIGHSRFVIIGALARVPGEVGVFTAIGPRVYLPGRFLNETGLLRFGSRARYTALLKITGAAPEDFVAQHEELFRTQSVSVETAAEREKDFTRSLDLLARYLGLVGLIALLLGGLGVASAVHVFATGKLDTAAVLRCMGATQRTVFAVYLLQAAILGLLGAGAGAVLGMAVQASLPTVFADFLPVAVPADVSWPTVAAGLGVGVWVAVIFALRPLLTVRGVPPLKALRRDFEERSAERGALSVLVLAALVASVVLLGIWQAPDALVGSMFAGGVLVTTVILWVMAVGLTRVTRALLPRNAPYVVRQGIGNLFRPHNQTIAVTLAVGFGVFLLGTLYVVQRNLLDRVRVGSGPERPNLVLFDIQPDQRRDVERTLSEHGAPFLGLTPIVPARIARVRGQPIEELLVDTSDSRRSRWALTREYRNTYRDTLVGSETVVAGEWWGPGAAQDRRAGASETATPVQVSMEEDVAEELQVGLGDQITWDVQGVQIESRIASIRRVEWARFEPNFFVVFEPGVLERAPQSFVTLTRVDAAAGRAQLQRVLVSQHPNISALDLTVVQEALDRILGSVALAIQSMALFSIVSGLVVLVGAIATSRYQRLRESVLLRTLGARGRQIAQILMTEYGALGTLAALTGAVLAALAGWALMTFFFEIPFRLPVAPLAGLWIAAVALTTAIGMLSSRDVFRKAPLVMIREMGE